MDEEHLYHREALNDGDYSEDDCAEMDDAKMANACDLDDSKTASPIPLDDSLYSIKDNISKKPKKQGNASHNLEQDISIDNGLESKSSEPQEEISLETNSESIESSRLSWRAGAPQKIYPGQIIYGSAPISRKLG